jgi:hypothetical protein
MMPENLGGCVSDERLGNGIKQLSIVDASAADSSCAFVRDHVCICKESGGSYQGEGTRDERDG